MKLLTKTLEFMRKVPKRFKTIERDYFPLVLLFVFVFMTLAWAVGFRHLQSNAYESTKEKYQQEISIKQKKIEKALNIKRYPKHIGILICLYLGLRLGEVCALKWEDVDLKSQTMQICRTVYLKTDKNKPTILVFTTPKTKSSIRCIPIPTFLVDSLKQIKKHSTSEFVLSDKFGHCIIPRTYQYVFSSIQRRARVERKGFHSLRHTFATRALECGIDIKSLSEILGHKNPTITLTRYAHSMLSYKKNMINKIGKLYQSCS